MLLRSLVLQHSLEIPDPSQVIAQLAVFDGLSCVATKGNGERKLWRGRPDQPLELILSVPNSPTWGLALCQESLVMGGDNGVLQFLDRVTGEFQFSYSVGVGVKTLEILEDAKPPLLAAGCADGSVRFFSCTRAGCTPLDALQTSEHEISQLRFSPDGSMVSRGLHLPTA